MRRLCLIFMFAFGVHLLMCAQGSYARQARADELLNAINNRYTELDTLIFAPKVDANVSPYRSTLIGIDEVTAREDAIDAAIGRHIDAKVAEFKSDLGLQVTGQTYYRLDGMMGTDEDDPVSNYNGKIQVEARWSPLQSSLYNRKGNINAIKIQGEIDRTLQQRDRLDLSVYQQKEYFRQISDSLLAGVLQHHIINLDLLSQSNYYLLEGGRVSSDELLNVLDAKAEAERQLVTLRPGLPAAVDLSGITAYTVEVDTASLIKYIEDTAVDMRLLKLRLQLLDQQEKNVSYWEQCNIAPFVRYSYYFRDYAPNSQNIDAGVVFTIPINTMSSHKKRTIRAERNVLEAENIDLLRQVTDKVRYYATEIDRLNRASIGEVNRIAELKGYLRLRAQAYDNALGEYNRLSRLKEYNNYLICLEKLIAFQYQRDCYVADLQRLLNQGSILDFCRESIIQSSRPSLTVLDGSAAEKQSDFQTL